MKHLQMFGNFVLMLLLLQAGLSVTAKAQVSLAWEARYHAGYDYGTCVAVDDLGNVYVGGYKGPDYNQDYACFKYNANGVQQWAKFYDSPGTHQDFVTAIGLGPGRSVYITGGSGGGGTFDHDITTIRYTTEGDCLWVRVYNGPANDWDYGFDLVVDDDGNVFVAGSSTGSGTQWDIVTIKYDTLGVERWTVRYNGPGNSYDGGEAICLDAVGNVYVTGYSGGSGTTGSDITTIKYSPMGTQLWVARYTGTALNGADKGHAIAVDDEGNVYVTGERRGTSPNYYDYVTIKYDSLGNQLWVNAYNPNNSSDISYDLALDADANVYVTGGSDGVGTVKDWATISYTTDGVVRWVQRYNGPNNNYDEARALTLDDSANVYVVGSTYGATNLYDFTTIKYDSSGIQLWEISYDGPGNSNEDPEDIAVDEQGNVYITGGSVGVEETMDVCTIEYVQGEPPPPPVEITLTPVAPPIQIPASGGSFNFNANMTNNTTGAQTFAVWIMVQLPNQAWYGPVLGPLSLTLPGSASLTRLRTQAVPGSAPAGDYLYEGRVGVYPDSIWDSSNFPFTKLGSGGLGLGAGSWTNAGGEFDLGLPSGVPRTSDLALFAQPNPFNPTTRLTFSLPEAAEVDLVVFNSRGELVATLVEGYREAGTYQALFDGANLSTGVYFAHLRAGSYQAVKKMMLVK